METGPRAFILAVLIIGWGAAPTDEWHSASGQDMDTARVQRSVFQVGRTTFMQRCAVCHGRKADGKGSYAESIQPPKPADFRDEMYQSIPGDSIRRVIEDGGAATGRNPRMPAWGDELTDAEIRATVVFIRSVSRFGRVPTERQIRESDWFAED